MPRKKKTETTNSDDKFVYCGVWKCPHIQCFRHHVHEPWNICIIERKFNPDKNWNCKDMLED